MPAKNLVGHTISHYGIPERLDFGRWPLWTPDGKRLTFRSWRTGSFTMRWMPADGSGGEERLTTIGTMQSASSWSPDGSQSRFTSKEGV